MKYTTLEKTWLKCTITSICITVNFCVFTRAPQNMPSYFFKPSNEEKAICSIYSISTTNVDQVIKDYKEIFNKLFDKENVFTQQMDAKTVKQLTLMINCLEQEVGTFTSYDEKLTATTHQLKNIINTIINLIKIRYNAGFTLHNKTIGVNMSMLNPLNHMLNLMHELSTLYTAPSIPYLRKSRQNVEKLLIGIIQALQDHLKNNIIPAIREVHDSLTPLK